MDLTPADALVRDAGGERASPVDDVAPGAVIVVRPGEKVPLDGEVVAGQSAVNQAPVTGESLPVDKAPGDEVFAGTHQRPRRARRARDAAPPRHDARAHHPPRRAGAGAARAGADARRAVRARLHAGGDRAGGWSSRSCRRCVSARAGTTWIYRALVLLVVSCPCALVISTPVSIVAALAGAARKGVLIKGGAHLERASRVRCVAFDKTGTLTRGTPEVVDVVALNGADARVDRRARGVGRAAIRAPDRAGDSRLRRGARASRAAPARRRRRARRAAAPKGSVDGARVLLGNHRLFEERRLCSPAIHDAARRRSSARGRTAVLVARDGAADRHHRRRRSAARDGARRDRSAARGRASKRSSC